MVMRFPTLSCRLLSLVITISIVLGQTACGRNSQNMPQENMVKPTVFGSASPTETEEKQLQEIQSNTGQLTTEDALITFAAYEFERSIYEPLMAQFHEQNPAITVKFSPLQLTSGDSAESYFRTLASTADTVLVSGRSSELSVYFRDLQPQIDADADFRIDDFWPDALYACQDEQGRTIGVPVNLLMSGIYYDEQAFQTAGLPIPQPGWTWDDFRKAVATLVVKDADGTRYGFADPTYASVVSPLLGDHFLKIDGDIDPPSLVGELQWYVDLARQDALYPMQGTAGGAANQQAEEHWQALFQGNRPPAMWFGRLQDPIPGLAGISEDTDPSKHLAITRFGFAPFPVASSGSSIRTTPLAAQCVVMSAGTKYPQAAWKWAKFLTEHRILHDATQLAEKLVIPARVSVAEATGFWTNLPAGLQSVVQYGLSHSWYQGLYASSETAVYSALEQASVEGKDLTQALTEAKTRLATTRSQVTTDPNPVVIATPDGSSSPANGNPVILFYAGTTDTQEVQTLQSLVERFNRDHVDQFSVSLVINYSPAENQGYFEGLASKFDCFTAQVDPMGAAASDAILNLNSFLESEPPIFRQDYDPALLDRSRYEGALYNLPLIVQPAIVAYNADLLANRGLSLPSTNWTYDDFIRQITSIATPQGDEKAFGVLPESQAVDVPGMLFAGRNVQWLDISGNVPIGKMDTPEMANSLAWLSELYRSGAVFQSASGEDWWGSITRAIQSGQIAYWTVLAGQQNSLYFDGGQQPSFRIGIAPLPNTASNVAFDASIERGLYIAHQSAHAAECWSWAKYLSEQHNTWYGVPARTSISASPAWESSVGVENATVYRLALARLQGTRIEGNWKIMLLPLNSWRSQTEMGARNGEDIKQLLLIAQQKASGYQACLSQQDISSLKEAELREKVTSCAKQADPSW